jgi:hypothetical protein
MSVGPSDKFVAALQEIEKRVDRSDEGGMGFVPRSCFDELLALLMTMFCEHEYELKRMGGPPDSECSNEQASVCKKCGAER